MLKGVKMCNGVKRSDLFGHGFSITFVLCEYGSIGMGP